MWKYHLSNEKGACDCPAHKRAIARGIPAVKLDAFDKLPEEKQCKRCRALAGTWKHQAEAAGSQSKDA